MESQQNIDIAAIVNQGSHEEFVSKLGQSLQATMATDNTIRQQAGKFIKAAQRREGYCSALIEISAN